MADSQSKTDAVEDPDVLYSRVVDFQRRIATNMNDLHHELSPKVMAENAKQTATELVQNPDGSFKKQALVIAGVAVAAVVLVVVLKRKK